MRREDKNLKNLILAILLFFALFPFFLMFQMSLKPPPIALEPTLIFIPTLDNYLTVLNKGLMNNLVNSLIVATFSALITMVCSVPTSYVFSRRKLSKIMFIYFITLFIPLMPIAITSFFVSQKIGLYDTHLFVILMLCTLRIPFTCLLVKPFFDAIPIEIEEAASIDGCTKNEVFIKIILPLAIPAIICGFLYAFFLSWNDFSLTFLITGSNTKLATAFLMELRGYYGRVYWSEIAAGTILVSIPGIIFAFLLQKYFIKGFSGVLLGKG